MRLMRNLALVALAAGVLLALPAGALASGGFAADQYPASVKASGGQFKITVGKTSRTCSVPVLDATLKAPVHSLTVTQTEKGACTGGTVDMNGCQLILNPSTKSADIGPPGCGPVSISGGTCTSIMFFPQTGLSTTYTGAQIAEGIVGAEGLEVSGTVNVTSLTSFCFGSETGTLTANWGLATTNEAKEANNLLSSRDFVPIGISLTNEKHPRTRAQVFPVNVAAVHGNPVDQVVMPIEIPLNSTKLKVWCPEANLSAGELTKETESVFSLSGTYGGYNPGSSDCKASGGPTKATVKMNSCRYDLPEIEQTGSSYTVKGAAIACTKEGDAISAVTNAGCNLYIPPQPLQATLTSGGFGFAADVPLDVGTNSLKYTSSGAFCKLGGVKESGEDGVMNQELALRGTLSG